MQGLCYLVSHFAVRYPFIIDWQNHSKIKIVDFDFYSMNESSNDVLLAISGWATVHPLLRVIPVEWEHSIPYGLLHAPQPSENSKTISCGSRGGDKKSIELKPFGNS